MNSQIVIVSVIFALAFGGLLAQKHLMHEDSRIGGWLRRHRRPLEYVGVACMAGGLGILLVSPAPEGLVAAVQGTLVAVGCTSLYLALIAGPGRA
jgi:hypothetical protein